MKRNVKIMLQLLPAIVVAAAVFIYLLSFVPLPDGRMARSVALVERVAYYRICADGRTVAWFGSLGDSLSADGLVLPGDSAAVSRGYANGVWVDKYPFFPSCPGLMLVAWGDSLQRVRLSAAAAGPRAVVERAVARLAADSMPRVRRLGELDYYMRVHNVNDDGYNVMAERAAAERTANAAADSLLRLLRGASAARSLTVERVTAYTLLYNDTAGNVCRKACAMLAEDMSGGFALLQTADREKPSGAVSLYLHQWLTPESDTGDSITVAAMAGCASYGYSPSVVRPVLTGGAADGRGGHDVPPLLAPDGAAVFSRCGWFEGFSMGGRIVRPCRFGYGLKHLLP